MARDTELKAEKENPLVILDAVVAHDVTTLLGMHFSVYTPVEGTFIGHSETQTLLWSCPDVGVTKKMNLWFLVLVETPQAFPILV